MRYAQMALVGLLLRRPLLAGIIVTFLGIGVGVALASPGITWRWGAAPAARPAATLERAFRSDEAAGPPGSGGPTSDFALTDQAGRRVRFREQAGKVLLVNFVTTRCTTTCVQVTRELRGLQQALGDRMGRDVAFLSIGIDPRRDTPTALRRFARRHGAEFTGWSFLSGTAEELEAARRAFGALAMPVPRGRGHVQDDFEHTSTTYLVDRQGVLRKKITPGVLTLVGLHEVDTALASSH